MNVELDKDLMDFLKALNNAEVRYLVVGGVSVIIHGYARTTMDLDIWVDRTAENYQRILAAFSEFGMPTFGMTEDVFLNDDNMDVFTFGRPPVCIDLMNKVKGLVFGDSYLSALDTNLGDCRIKVVSKSDLVKAKLAAGRHKDLDDVEHLEGKDAN